MDILNFAVEHKEIIITIGCSLTAWLLPNPKLTWLGKKVGYKIPPKIAKIIKEKLDAFEEGLIIENVDGDHNLISNAQLKEKKKDLEINLGLDQPSKEKTSL